MRLSWVQAAARSRIVLLAMMLCPLPSLAQPYPVVVQTGDPQPAFPEDSYLVKLASAHSESDVRTAYDRLQERYPALLKSRAAIIKKFELQVSSGPLVYYRALIGPFDRDAAVRFCKRLQKAGAACVVSRR
jgi:hypothetical protein